MLAGFAKRGGARRRLESLFVADERAVHVDSLFKLPRSERNSESSSLLLLIEQARVPLSRAMLLLLCAISGTALFALSSMLLIRPVAIGFFVVGFIAPLMWLRRRARERAVMFLEDYPSVLLATSSSVRAGLTPVNALERAVELLPESSLCRQETKKLVADLNANVPLSVALMHYGRSVCLPELELFRMAFLMVMDSGGRFAPALKRLAQVSSDTSVLMQEAQVATASMRMTGNLLLLLLPVLLSILNSQNDNYWNLLLNHPVGEAASSVGIVVIVVGQLVLRIMSDFKP